MSYQVSILHQKYNFNAVIDTFYIFILNLSKCLTTFIKPDDVKIYDLHPVYKSIINIWNSFIHFHQSKYFL